MANCRHLVFTISLVFCLNVAVKTQYDGIRAGSQCFHVKGVPTLKLQCPAGELIRIHTAFYGTKMREDSEGASLLDMQTVCAYESGEDHCIQLTDMHENCMGRYMCSVYVSNPFLMNCRTYANYMQVNYTCVPRFAIHNICETRSITTVRGYIRTPHYPDANYSSNLHCGCRLATSDPHVHLRVLDFSVNHTDVNNCDTDYLRIGSWGRKCGIISPERLPEQFVTDSSSVNLEFHSDDSHSGRGVWLEYSGSNGNPVTMTCGPAEPRARLDKDDVIIQFTDRADIHSNRQHNSEYETNIDGHADAINFLEANKAFDSLVIDPIHAKKDFDTVDNVIDPSNAILETVLPVLHETINADNVEWKAKYINDNYMNIEEDPYTIETVLYHGMKHENNVPVHNARNTDAYGEGDILNHNNVIKDEAFKHDQVYKPFEGHWDLPGVDDKSTKNMNIEESWNNGLAEPYDTETTARTSSDKPLLDSSQSGSTAFKTSYGAASSSDSDKDIPRLYGIDTVQIITGVFVGVLILIAVIIIIVLVFRRT